MRRAVARTIGAALVAALVLSGCDVISRLIDDLSGGDAPLAFRSARISFSLQANVTRSDVHPQETTVEPRTLIVAFDAAGSYDPLRRTFSAVWDGGDYSETAMEIRLASDAASVASFEVRQTRVHSAGAWTEVYAISGRSVPFLIADGASRLYLIEGSETSASIESIEYREWPNSVGDASHPYYRLAPPQLANIWSDATSYVEIRLDP
jgi:hypothetical protein